MEINLKDINWSFHIIKAPINIRRVLANDNDFMEWLNLGTKEDLICTLREFENSEMYEDCVLINNFIKKKYGKSN